MSENLRTLVVVNPRSSGGSTAKRWRRIAAALDGSLSGYDRVETRGPGHATELVRNGLRDGVQMIIAVGGDGTINEVVNGFYDGDEPVAESPILGLLPSGTGGDYRKTWGLDREPASAVARLAGGELRSVDLGRVRCRALDGTGEVTRYFANVASFGLSARICQRVNASSKVLGGRASFFLASARALMGYHGQAANLRTDGEERRFDSITVGACCIGRYFGGGMMIGPNADPADGAFDVVTLNRVGRFDMMRMTSLYSGKHLEDPNVSCWRGAVVEATLGESSEPLLIETEGEVVGQLPARFEVLPGAFRIKV